jgi:hypothetical protein
MQAIATRKKEINATQSEQQNMVDMVSVVTNKALTLFTQLSNVLVTTTPLIEQLHNTYITSPQVTVVHVDVMIQLMKKLHDQFTKPECRFHELVKDLQSNVSSITEVIP